MAEFEIDFEQINARVRECIMRSFELIDSRIAFAATSYGVSLDSRFGRFLICINDDESYRCDEVATFTGPTLCGVDLVQIDEFREKYESSEADEELRAMSSLNSCTNTSSAASNTPLPIGERISGFLSGYASRSKTMVQ